MLNSPLNFIDPSGHREVRYTEGEWITQEVFSEYAGEWDIAKQARNRAIIETIFSVADTVAAILWEPYDWVSTGARCTQGGCNALDYAGFLPLIPGALGRVDDVARAANRIDNTVDTARNGESVVDLFRAVSPEEFDDIMKTGQFRPHPGGFSLNAKQFGLNFEETLQYADKYSEYGAIVKATIPVSVLQLLDLTHLDPFIFKSGTVTAAGEALELLNRSLIGPIEQVF